MFTTRQTEKYSKDDDIDKVIDDYHPEISINNKIFFRKILIVALTLWSSSGVITPFIRTTNLLEGHLKNRKRKEQKTIPKFDGKELYKISFQFFDDQSKWEMERMKMTEYELTLQKIWEVFSDG